MKTEIFTISGSGVTVSSAIFAFFDLLISLFWGYLIKIEKKSGDFYLVVPISAQSFFFLWSGAIEKFLLRTRQKKKEENSHSRAKEKYTMLNLIPINKSCIHFNIQIYESYSFQVSQAKLYQPSLFLLCFIPKYLANSSYISLA